MTNTKTFEVGDRVVVAGFTDVMWRIHEMVPQLNADGTASVRIGLTDVDDPRHGTAMSGDVLAAQLLEHFPALTEDRIKGADMIEQLTADLFANGWFSTPGSARIVAGRLVALGWRR